jgi:hypothetical protein
LPSNGQRVATRVDGTLYYIHQDHLGSTVALSDAAGQAVGQEVNHEDVLTFVKWLNLNTLTKGFRAFRPFCPFFAPAYVWFGIILGVVIFLLSWL